MPITFEYCCKGSVKNKFEPLRLWDLAGKWVGIQYMLLGWWGSGKVRWLGMVGTRGFTAGPVRSGRVWKDRRVSTWQWKKADKENLTVITVVIFIIYVLLTIYKNTCSFCMLSSLTVFILRWVCCVWAESIHKPLELSRVHNRWRLSVCVFERSKVFFRAERVMYSILQTAGYSPDSYSLLELECTSLAFRVSWKLSFC